MPNIGTDEAGQLLEGEWHKVLALVMHKLKVHAVVITADNVRKLPAGQCIMAEEKEDGLHVRLIDMAGGLHHGRAGARQVQ